MKQIGVIGTHLNPTRKSLEEAERLGRLLAKKGFVVVCGGLGGVMEAVCRGAKSERGTTVGVLPGKDIAEANPFVDYRIATGLEWARNQVVALSCDAIVMIGGEAGTLSELCVGWIYKKPIIAIRGTGGYSDEFAGKAVDGKRNDVIMEAKNAEEAVALLTKILGGVK
ncbi:MAG: TIGR00725 family protein [Candidatus Micrarchaeia archaeon]